MAARRSAPPSPPVGAIGQRSLDRSRRSEAIGHGPFCLAFFSFRAESGTVPPSIRATGAVWSAAQCRIISENRCRSCLIARFRVERAVTAPGLWQWKTPVRPASRRCSNAVVRATPAFEQGPSPPASPCSSRAHGRFLRQHAHSKWLIPSEKLFDYRRIDTIASVSPVRQSSTTAIPELVPSRRPVLAQLEAGGDEQLVGVSFELLWRVAYRHSRLDATAGPQRDRSAQKAARRLHARHRQLHAIAAKSVPSPAAVEATCTGWKPGGMFGGSGGAGPSTGPCPPAGRDDVDAEIGAIVGDGSLPIEISQPRRGDHRRVDLLLSVLEIVLSFCAIDKATVPCGRPASGRRLLRRASTKARREKL
ncbi:unnamed protein product [Acanthosepion pharaonis]|uniref:Uncharacterized protein n=1 Tax=Acanthosepion pharaonis TaxID=158019 RepID=A0A812DGY9_ACAPH|nr:unnamed protein product [Sepia pharaonis]